MKKLSGCRSCRIVLISHTYKNAHSRTYNPAATTTIKLVLHLSPPAALLLPAGHAQVVGDSSYFWLHTLSHAKHFQEAVVFSVYNALGKQMIVCVCVCVCGINWKECVWTPCPLSVFALPESYEEWSGLLTTSIFFLLSLPRCLSTCHSAMEMNASLLS